MDHIKKETILIIISILYLVIVNLIKDNILHIFLFVATISYIIYIIRYSIINKIDCYNRYKGIFTITVMTSDSFYRKFTITVMTSDSFYRKEYGKFNTQRIFGYTFTKKEAEILVNNFYIKNEINNFRYVVIEEVFPGLCNSDNYNYFWYKFDNKTKKYKPIKPLKEWNNIKSISIG